MLTLRRCRPARRGAASSSRRSPLVDSDRSSRPSRPRRSMRPRSLRIVGCPRSGARGCTPTRMSARRQARSLQSFRCHRFATRSTPRPACVGAAIVAAVGERDAHVADRRASPSCTRRQAWRTARTDRCPGPADAARLAGFWRGPRPRARFRSSLIAAPQSAGDQARG